MSTIELTPLQSTTANDICQEALENIGVVHPEQPLSANLATNTLRTLNFMLDTLSVDGLMIPYLTLESFALTADQESYTIGANGDFNTTRPDSIEARSCFTRDADDQDRYLLPMAREEYRTLFQKSGSGISSHPEYLYYDPQYPLGRIYLYSPPISGLTLHVASFKPFTSFADLTTEVSFPAGYKELLSCELTIRLAPKHGEAVPPVVAAMLQQIRARLQMKHVQPVRKNMSVPMFSKGSSGGGWNVPFES